MNTLKAEYLKTKNTATAKFTMACALFLPVLFFLIYLFRYKRFIPVDGVNPWDGYFDNQFSLLAGLFFPFYLVLSAALNLNFEHKSSSWKKLLLVPQSRTNTFLNKGLFLFLQTVFAIGVFYLAYILFGYLLGAVHPELKLLEYTPSFLNNLILLGRLFIASMGVLSIQYVLSLVSKNIILPITIGIVLTIAAFILINGWEHSVYFPYAFPNVFYLNETGRISVDMYLGITISEWCSIATTIVAMFVGNWLFKRKQLI